MIRLWASAINKADNPKNLEVVFYIDNDDLDSYRIYQQLQANYGNQIKKIVSERVVVSKMWNQCAKIATGDIMMRHQKDGYQVRVALVLNI